MSAKVSQLEATAAKFFHLLFPHSEHFLHHALDKHLKYHYKTNAQRFKLASFCINVLSAETPTLLWSQKKFKKYLSEE